MATRESNVIMFPQRIDPECKEDFRIAEQFLAKIDGLVMKGLRRDLAAAETRVLAGDAGAAGDVEYLCLLIRRHRDAIRREAIAKYALAREALDGETFSCESKKGKAPPSYRDKPGASPGQSNLVLGLAEQAPA